VINRVVVGKLDLGPDRDGNHTRHEALVLLPDGDLHRGYDLRLRVSEVHDDISTLRFRGKCRRGDSPRGVRGGWTPRRERNADLNTSTDHGWFLCCGTHHDSHDGEHQYEWLSVSQTQK
jgi:hypothetical protein